MVPSIFNLRCLMKSSGPILLLIIIRKESEILRVSRKKSSPIDSHLTQLDSQPSIGDEPLLS